MLGVPTGLTFQSTHMLDFDSAAFIAKSEANGGFDAYVHAVAALADTGESANFTKGPAQAPAPDALGSATAAAGGTSDSGKLLLTFAKGIAKGALKQIGGDFAGGWTLEEVSKAAGYPPDEQGKLRPAFDKISKQLDGISTQISNLSLQVTNEINALKKLITAQTDLVIYQNNASLIQRDINSISNMQQNLEFLAMSAANGEFNQSEATVLLNQILTNAGANLLDVYTGLEGAKRSLQ